MIKNDNSIKPFLVIIFLGFSFIYVIPFLNNSSNHLFIFNSTDNTKVQLLQMKYGGLFKDNYYVYYGLPKTFTLEIASEIKFYFQEQWSVNGTHFSYIHGEYSLNWYPNETIIYHLHYQNVSVTMK